MAQIYNVISITAFSIAVISFILSLFFLVKFHIPTLIGDLSGRTARKSIAEMRSHNSSRKKSSMPEKVLSNRVTVPETGSGTVLRKEEDGSEDTTLLSQENGSEETTLLTRENGSEETMLLTRENGSEETMLLHEDGSEETTLLSQENGSEETTLLTDYDGEETTMLSATGELEGNPDAAHVAQPQRRKLKLLQNIILIHTDEIID